MLVFGTQVHIVTFIFIVLEFIMFCFQFIYYLFRPQDKPRKWYLILLALMLFYNITGWLFPDPNIAFIPVAIQGMIAYGSGFLMASYFPFYFVKYPTYHIRLGGLCQNEESIKSAVGKLEKIIYHFDMENNISSEASCTWADFLLTSDKSLGV